MFVNIRKRRHLRAETRAFLSERFTNTAESPAPTNHSAAESPAPTNHSAAAGICLSLYGNKGGVRLGYPAVTVATAALDQSGCRAQKAGDSYSLLKPIHFFLQGIYRIKCEKAL